MSGKTSSNYESERALLSYPSVWVKGESVKQFWEGYIILRGGIKGGVGVVLAVPSSQAKGMLYHPGLPAFSRRRMLMYSFM